MMKTLNFYTKSNCHLCEDAYQIIENLDVSLIIEKIDIDLPENSRAAALYGERVPVLTTPNQSLELGWPFTAEEILDFIK